MDSILIYLHSVRFHDKRAVRHFRLQVRAEFFHLALNRGDTFLFALPLQLQKAVASQHGLQLPAGIDGDVLQHMQNGDFGIIAVGQPGGITEYVGGIFGKVGRVKNFFDFR